MRPQQSVTVSLMICTNLGIYSQWKSLMTLPHSAMASQSHTLRVTTSNTCQNIIPHLQYLSVVTQYCFLHTVSRHSKSAPPPHQCLPAHRWDHWSLSCVSPCLCCIQYTNLSADIVWDSHCYCFSGFFVSMCVLEALLTMHDSCRVFSLRTETAQMINKCNVV